MEVSDSNKGKRRKLFVPAQSDHPLTDLKLQVLLSVAEAGVLTVRQIASLTGMTDRAVTEHARNLYDMRFLDRTAIPRLTGRAPMIYFLRKEGAKILLDNQMVAREDVANLPSYGPDNALFLQHEIETRDVLVWLTRIQRTYGLPGLKLWKTGSKAHINPARPDAFFIFKFNNAQLVGMVEVDRGTMKSPSRWMEKFEDYASVYSSGAIELATGFKTGRVVVVTPDIQRRDAICDILTGMAMRKPVPRDRFWIAEKSVLESSVADSPVWRVAGRSELLPLVGRQELT